MTIDELTEEVKEKLKKARNERGLPMKDHEVNIFAVEWENVCNLLNKKRSTKLC